MSGSTVSRLSFDAARGLRQLRRILEGVGFWTAVVLPFLYLPAIAMGRLLPVPPTVLVVAVGLNVLALVVGHRHEPRYPQGWRPGSSGQSGYQ